MAWVIISALMGIFTDFFLQKHLKLHKRPLTFLFSLLSCVTLIAAFDNPMLIVKGCIFSQTLIIAGYLDYKTREIPDILLLPAALCGLINMQPLSSMEGAVLVFLVMFSVSLIKQGVIGGGDIKLMTACGFTLGLWSAWSASILSLLLFQVMALIRRRSRKDYYPLGPYIGIGCFIAYILT